MKPLSYCAAFAVIATFQASSAYAQSRPCTAENGVTYDPVKVFDPEHQCYPKDPTDCPDLRTVCSNHALIKLADYGGEGKANVDRQDLIYSPHRGLWGQTYGSSDPSVQQPPAQNTNDAFSLVSSFIGPYRVNLEGKYYGEFLRGGLVELDMTVSGGDLPGDTQEVLVDHYITTANTVEGNLNTYLASMGKDAIAVAHLQLERRDFSASPMLLSETPVGQVTRKSIVDPKNSNYGLIAYHDIKARRGQIQCQTSDLKPGTKEYERYHCKYNEPEVAEHEQLNAEIRSAAAMYDAGGSKNIVIKTTASFPKMLESVAAYYRVPREQALEIMKRYMWQPHPKGARGSQSETIQGYVQYIHEWLVSVPRSVQAWEMNIYHSQDTTNLPFCVTSYAQPDEPFPLGDVAVKRVSDVRDRDGCAFGPYYNMLDYLRQNAGNPKYFGFPKELLETGPISGNRANLWLLDTAAAAGTSDREYRWQMLGSDATYNMSDAVRYLSYPYVAYQILNADRLDVVKQAIDKGLYQKWGPDGPTVRDRAANVATGYLAPGMSNGGNREVLESRLEKER